MITLHGNSHLRAKPLDGRAEESQSIRALLFLPLGSIAARCYFLYAKVQRLQGRSV
ncbi:hypothetical protein ACX12E_07855 [Paenibacillus vandeheii]